MEDIAKNAAKASRDSGNLENCNYRSYVGPSAFYDISAASQFALLCACGLREGHSLLDFGCGSLRGGKLFIPYLLPGRYYGIEPNAWLVEDGLKHELGKDIVAVKQPHFSYNDDFSIPFDVPFDFMLAQSIFSHTGKDLLEKGLAAMALALAPSGLLCATFFIGPQESGEQGWVYPGRTVFRAATLLRVAAAHGLHGVHVPWFHPAHQQWFLFSRDPARLPGSADTARLCGINVMEAAPPAGAL